MGKTPIQWTDHSINPIRARGPNGRNGHHCVKVSPGCKNCYASRFQPRVGLPQFQEQRGEKTPEMFLDPKMLAQVLRRKKPTKFFWCDMTDMFGDWVPFEWIAACFGVMAATPQHTHQVLTKRAGRMREFFEWIVAVDPACDPWTNCHWFALQNDDEKETIHRHSGVEDGRPWPLPNVHLGVSAEDQQRADERIPELLRCPAAVHWVSAEPLLGPIDFSRWEWPMCWHWASPYKTPEEALAAGAYAEKKRQALVSAHARFVKWIVVGGESGKRARPFDVQWARDIIAQGRAADVPVFVKQLGANPIHLGAWPNPKDGHGGDIEEWAPDLRVREFPR